MAVGPWAQQPAEWWSPRCERLPRWGCLDTSHLVTVILTVWTPTRLDVGSVDIGQVGGKAPP